MSSKQKYIEGTRIVLGKAKEEKTKYETQVLDRKFIVYPQVFSPKYFHDTEFFAKSISVIRGEDFLEIGSGTGVISIFAAIRGAGKVVATDISENAVQNTLENIRRYRLEDVIEVRKGNLFEPLGNDEKFNTIFWNIPFSYLEEESMSELEQAVFDPYYKSAQKFIAESVRHLKQGGRLLIGFSKTIGSYDKLEEFLIQNNFKSKIVAQHKSVAANGLPVTFELIECRIG